MNIYCESCGSKITTRPKAKAKFILVPAGSFIMGSPEDEKGRYSDEAQRQVTIKKSFWLQETPITQQQWTSVMDINPSYPKGEMLPVENISWHDAKEFIAKLNLKSKKWHYRLPTEAEWEYACRAGTTSAYYWGNENSVNYAWSYENSNHTSHPVKEKLPNQFGLYDMCGNVWEWGEDLYSNQGSYRVFRGGSWSSDAGDLRSAFRSGGGSGFRYQSLGARLVREGK